MNTKTNPAQVRKMLPDGEIKRMAEWAGVPSATVSITLKCARPGNRLVLGALKIARENGALGAAQAMAALPS